MIIDNTQIVFMGDNGGALLRGKGTLYDCGLHVPLLIRWPGKIKPGRTNGENKIDKRFAGTILFTKERPMFELYDQKSRKNG